MSDLDMINGAEVTESPIYAMIKAVMNVVTAKFNLEYKKNGVLFIGICPGIFQGKENDPSKHQELAINTISSTRAAEKKKLTENMPIPHRGPQSVADVVPKIAKIWEDASLEKGDGGAVLTHTGIPGQWL
ncbi:hypothetical protein F4678DRAFT_465397 [Xylaria arbuscula]|nr:hypothetical protein F4678DRAFT_465397 [Xylaria arbuscula]